MKYTGPFVELRGLPISSQWEELDVLECRHDPVPAVVNLSDSSAADENEECEVPDLAMWP